MNGSDSLRRAEGRDVLFLSTPALWQHWPFLPLVRRRGGGATDYGVLADLYGSMGVTGYGATVFRTNLFLLPRRLEDFLQLPHESFDTAQEVAAAGWTVD